MSLRLSPSTGAVGFGKTKSFVASGGVEPYIYSVIPGGAGGLIDPNGYYSSPPVPNADPAKGYDTVKVTDAASATATSIVLVCTAEQLVLDILKRELGLSDSHAYLWDQKIPQPKDFDLYIVVGILSCKPFSNSFRQIENVAGDFQVSQTANFQATLSIDIFSRGPAARDRKEEVVMALNSYYAQSQQEANSFKIAKISSSFTNLSDIDGAAIPYRFNISVNILYAVQKVQDAPYFDKFSNVEIVVDP